MKRPTTESTVRTSANALIDAAETLIDIIRTVEAIEKQRSLKSSFILDYEMPDGSVDHWTITIERTASSH